MTTVVNNQAQALTCSKNDTCLECL